MKHSAKKPLKYKSINNFNHNRYINRFEKYIEYHEVIRRCDVRRTSVNNVERFTMDFQTFVSTFLTWTENKVETKKDDGFPVCPFARRARMMDLIQFIDARTDAPQQLRSFDKSRYEIGIAWMGDSLDYDLELLASDMEKEFSDLFFFTSTNKSGHFVKNFTNCIFIQLKKDILDKRDYLNSTNYYNSWPAEYYKLITGHEKP